jgi:hypothetical protein
MPVINDWDYGAKGFLQRNYETHPYGSLECCAPFNLPTIPRSEWPDRINEGHKSKSFLSHLMDQAGVPILNQNPLPYCHAFSACLGVMGMRCSQNAPFTLLSASSIGGIVTGYQERGAYIFDDLKATINTGVAPASMYEMRTTRNVWTPESKAEALKYRVTEWWDLENRNFDQTMTCLLSRIPVCVGLNHWSHAVTYLDPIYKDGKFGVLMQNSWGGGWGTNGRAVFMEGYGSGRATPDEQYAPRQITGA